MESVGEFVSAHLKQHDRDRFNATLMLPQGARESVQALYAFNAEVSQVRDRVSEPAPGEIRLQWWVDLFEGAEHGQARDNPVADALLQTINRFDLPTGPLRRLLAARRFDLYDDAMPDLETFEGYAGETNSVLYQFSSMIVNAGNDAGAADAAGHMGVAHALTGHLLALSTTASRGQLFLPSTVLQAHGVSENDIFAGNATTQIQNACAQLRDIARDHLNKADTAIGELPVAVRAVFAHTTLVRERLNALDKFAKIPFVAPPEPANWQKLAKLAWWMFKTAR